MYKTDIKLNLIDKFVRGIQGGFCTKRLFYSTLYSVHFITEMYQTGIHSKTEWSLTGKQHWGRVHINQAIYQFIAKQNEVLLVNNIEEGSISIKLFIRDQLAMVHHHFFIFANKNIHPGTCTTLYLHDLLFYKLFRSWIYSWNTAHLTLNNYQSCL